jgi:hypothetical protein
MNFCNLLKGFAYQGHNFTYNLIEDEMSGPELFVFAEDEKGKLYLKENRAKVERFVKECLLGQ